MKPDQYRRGGGRGRRSIQAYWYRPFASGERVFLRLRPAHVLPPTRRTGISYSDGSNAVDLRRGSASGAAGICDAIWSSTCCASGSTFDACATTLLRHLAVRIRLTLCNARVDLTADAVDLVVRTGDLPDSGLRVRRLAVSPFVVVASPACLSTHGSPTSFTDVASERGDDPDGASARRRLSPREA